MGHKGPRWIDWFAVLGASLAARERCSERSPSPPSSWEQRLDRELRCEDAKTHLDRERCFSEILSIFQQWPTSPERDRAMIRARSSLESWPASQRAARTAHVIHEREGRVLDTMQLVRTLTDWYPEDTDRVYARLTQLTIESPFAESIESFTLVRAPVSYRWFTRGPGLSRLRTLALRDTGEPAHDFESLVEWKGLATLESFALYDEGSFVAGNSLWSVLREARALRSLTVQFFGAAAAVHRLGVEPAVSARLRTLSLRSGYLGARELDALVANASLCSLSVLDLRGNSLLDEDLSRLRAAPQFARTEILAGPAPR